MTFEQWWKQYIDDGMQGTTHEDLARMAWDAALEAQKEAEKQKELDMPW